MVKLYLNGTELTNFILSTPYKDTIDIELDKLNFQIKSENVISFSKWDKITYKLQVSKNNTTYDLISKNFCLFDWVETYEGGFWLYQLTLLSPTKILDNVIINGMAETYASSNLYYQFYRVVDKINAQLKYENSYNGVQQDELVIKTPNSITSDNLGNLTNYPINDFLWDGQQTAREILQDICDKADMILIATDFTLSGNKITEVYVDAVKKNKQTNKIQNETNFKGSDINAISSVVKGITYHRDNEFNNYNLISLTKNMICKDNKQTMYLPARNDDLTIDKADTWHILTDEPIYSLNRVNVMLPIKCKVSYWYLNGNNWVEKIYETGGSEENVWLYLPFDITNYIVEKDVFDAMKLSEQAKHLYFKRGEKGIYGLYDRYKSGLTGLFSNTAMENIASELTSNVFYNLGGYTDYYNNSNDVVVFSDQYAMPKLLEINGSNVIEYTRQANEGTSLNPIYVNLHLSSGNKENGAISGFNRGSTPYYDDGKSALFSVNYQPYTDSVVKIKEAKSNSNGYNVSSIKNQSDRNIDASKYYDSQIALSKKLGQEEMTLDVMYDANKLADYYISNEGVYKDAFYQLGDYFGDKTWLLTQREIEQYGVDKIKCRFTFSKNYNAKNCMINVSRDKRLYGIPLNNYVDRYIVLKKRDESYRVRKVLIESYDDFTGNTTTFGYALLEPTKVGNATRIDYVARCKDNYASAIERTKYSNTIVNVNLRYTGNISGNNDGFRDTINLRVADSGWENLQSHISDYSRLPFILDSDVNSYIVANTDHYYLYDIKKDKMERLIFVFIP